MGRIAGILGGGSLFPDVGPLQALPPVRPPEEDEGGNIVGNFFGDVKDAAVGLSQLVGNVAHDVFIKAPQQLFGSDQDFATDDIAKALPGALVDQVKQWGNPGKYLTEHPGFALLDLITLGSGAGKLAQAAGTKAIAGTAAEASARLATETVGRAAGTRLGLEALAESRPLSAGLDLARRILPKSETRVLGEELVLHTPAANPVRRALTSPIERMTTAPLGQLEQEAAELAERVAIAGKRIAPGDKLYSERLTKLVNEARARGATKVYRAPVTNLHLRRAANKVVGAHMTEFLSRRGEDLTAVQQTLKPLVEEGLTDQAAAAFQRLDVPDEVLAGIGPHSAEGATAGLRSTAEGAPGGLATVARPTLGDPLAAFDEMAASTDTLAQRVAEVARPTRDWVEGLREQAAELQAAGGEVYPELARELALSERALQSLYRPVTLEAEEKAGRVVSTLERTQENMRLVTQERFTNPIIEAGIRTPGELYERSYLGLRHRTGARYDKTLGDFQGGRDVLELDDTLAARGIAPPIYFPHIDARRLRFSDFLKSRKAEGAKLAAQAGHLKRDTAYLLDKELYVRDPVEAYSRRAARALRAEETARFVEAVSTKFGRPIASMDELGPAEAVWAPEGVRRYFRGKIKLEDEIADLMGAGLSSEEALAGALKEVFAGKADEIAREYVGVTKKGVKLYAIPRTVADQIELHTKLRMGKGVRLFWDAPTNAWRAVLLPLSPRWLVNNTLGNAVFLRMQGGQLRGVLAQLDKEYAAALQKIPGIKEAEGGFASNIAQFSEHLGSAGRSKAGQAITAAKSSRAGRAVQKATDRSRWLNSVTEDAFRREAYLTALERQQVRGAAERISRVFWSSKRRLEDIARRGVSPEMANKALEEANKFFGDYKTLGPVERNVIRRFLAPFWGFYRHVLRLSASYPLEMPLRTEVLRSLADVTKDMIDALGPVPEWAENAAAIGEGAEAGDVRFLSTRGANPLSLIGELADDPFRAALSAAHPIPKIVYERATGRSSFTGREFSDPDVVSGGFGSDERFRIGTDEAGNQTATPVDKVTPGLLEHLLQQFPPYQDLKEAIGGGSTYTASGLLDVLNGKGVITDPETGEPRYPKPGLEQLGELFGLNTFDVNVPEYQERLRDQQLAAIKDYIRRTGGTAPQAAGLSAARPGSIASLLSAPLF